MNEPSWIELPAVLSLHHEQLIAFGGTPGIRDRGLIESALARPQHLYQFGAPDLFDLAAAYAAGLSQNHGFVDGNKRISFIVAATFLIDNGHDVQAEQGEVIAAMLALADHKIDEAGLAQWLRDRSITRPALL